MLTVMDARALTEAAAELAAALPGVDVRTGVADRERYARDKSSFQVLPAAVAVVRNADEVGALVEAAAVHSLPLTARAGGSSVAGQCLGQGLIVDLAGLAGIEPVAGGPDGVVEKVVCGPGALLDDVNATLAGHGRQIGPDTTSSMVAKAGGLVGTNACGARSLRYGRFGDHLAGAEVVMAGGGKAVLVPGGVPDALAEPLAAQRQRAESAVKHWPRQHRTYGGYRLDAFAETGDALSLVAGSEGTLCIATSLTLGTVPRPERRVLDAVGYPTMRAALDSTAAFVERGAVAVELLDSHQLAAARRENMKVPGSASDQALLLVEYLDTEPATISGERLEGEEAEWVWLLRQAALWLATSGGRIPVAVFEDPAVSPERLGSFADAIQQLLARIGFEAIVYGHAAAGCLHVRPIVDPDDPELARRLEVCLPAVVDLVGEYGGALTGEHGWGLARSYLAASAVGHDVYECFREIKHIFDPREALNPGKIVGGHDPFVWFEPETAS